VKIVIPAAGQGVRLRPHTHTIPKVMLPVAGRPIIGHILADVAPLEPEEVRLIVGYYGDRVERYVREAFPEMAIRIVWQAEQLGLGHAVLQGLDDGDHDPVLVILGDTVFDVDYEAEVARREHVLGVRRVPDPERFGIVELTPEGDRIVKLVEKPQEPRSDLALVGLYWVTDGEKLRAAIAGLVSEDVRTRGEYQLTDALQRMIDSGERFAPFEIGDWFDCGKPETLLETNRQLLDRRGGTPDRADRWRRAAIVPPVYLDEDCVIENAVVGPHVSLARGATIRDSVVRDSIIAERASVEGLVMERSIIGPDVRVRRRPAILNLGELSEIEW
jgi:glucose-1-phosphate thymidylyltransferase